MSKETYFCNGDGSHQAREIILSPYFEDRVFTIDAFFNFLLAIDATVCPQCHKILKIIREREETKCQEAFGK